MAYQAIYRKWRPIIFEDVVVGPVVVSYTNKWLPDGVNVLNEGQFVVTFSYPKSSLE